jgi:hypothetical protein
MHTLIPRIEELIRLGLLPVAQLPVFKRAITYSDRGMVMPTPERQVFYAFMDKLVTLSIGDPMGFRFIRQKLLTTRTMRTEEMDPVNEQSMGTKTPSKMSDDMKQQVAADMAKRKAKRQAAIDAAGKEMAAHDKRMKEEVEQIDEVGLDGRRNQAAKNDHADSVGREFHKNVEKHRSPVEPKNRNMRRAGRKNMASNKGRDGGDLLKIRSSAISKLAWRKKIASRLKTEEVEQIDELSKKTLKSYVKKANTSAWRNKVKGDKEEDASMATDGMKYPAKQKKHMDNAGRAFDKQSKREHGVATATKKLKEEVELNKAPEGMLMNFAGIVKSKMRAGGKPTEGDKKLATKAKNELRRRRNVMSKRVMESAEDTTKMYADRIAELMQEFNIESLDALSPEQKAEFFSAI